MNICTELTEPRNFKVTMFLARVGQDSISTTAVPGDSLSSFLDLFLRPAQAALLVEQAVVFALQILPDPRHLISPWPSNSLKHFLEPFVSWLCSKRFVSSSFDKGSGEFTVLRIL